MDIHNKSVNCPTANMGKATTAREKKNGPISKSSSKLAALDRVTAKYAINDRTPLDKLNLLILDRITSENEVWIGRLLRDFLREVGQDGYRVTDLEHVTKILGFLATKLQDTGEYRMHLDRMLQLCKLPPLLEKTSDRLLRFQDMVQYFNGLGNLTSVLSNDQHISKILEALTSLATKPKPVPDAAVDFKFCRQAMELSDLAKIMAKLCVSSSPQIYNETLDFACILANISDAACNTMLEAGILDHLFSRMTVHHGEENGDQRAENVLARTTKVAHYLALSIVAKKNVSDAVSKFSGPSVQACRTLRDVFRYRVMYGRGSEESQILRNDLAVLILAALAANPPWESVRRTIADDLVALAVIDDSGVKGTWTEDVLFDKSDQDLIFKKILLATLFHLSNYGPAIATMIEKRVVPTILETMNPITEDVIRRWSPSQLSYLSQSAARVLPKLAKRMPEEFVRNRGSTRLLALLERTLNTDSESRLAMELTRAMCGLATSGCPLILKDLQEKGTARILLETIDRMLTLDSFTLRHQRAITLLLTAIEEIMNTEGEHNGRCENVDGLDTIIRLLHRCHQPQNADSPLDQRLLVSIGSYIWERVTRCSESGKGFINEGGIYAMLDATENSSLHVRCLYLGMLTDLTIDEQYSGAVLAHLSTWRGTDKTKGFLSLLANSWREEEIRKGVKRSNPEGCIGDVELPFMGLEQWMDTFHARTSPEFSPTLASFIGSVAPKISALRKIITNETECYSVARERYKIFSSDRPPLEDRITACVADHLDPFAWGQVWSEVSRNLERTGVSPLAMDGEIILLMNQRHRDWGVYVRELQEKILRAEKRRELEIERDEIARITDSRLGDALGALEEIDYIRRTSERRYAIAKKMEQRDRVNEALKLPDLSERKHYHRTFNDRFNFTTIWEHQHTIPGASMRSLEFQNTPPL